MFDFFNHTNYSGLVANLTNRFFRKFQGAGGARLVQLNARLRW